MLAFICSLVTFGYFWEDHCAHNSILMCKKVKNIKYGEKNVTPLLEELTWTKVLKIDLEGSNDGKNQL